MKAILRGVRDFLHVLREPFVDNYELHLSWDNQCEKQEICGNVFY
jgi:hypothetical protein